MRETKIHPFPTVPNGRFTPKVVSAKCLADEVVIVLTVLGRLQDLVGNLKIPWRMGPHLAQQIVSNPHLGTNIHPTNLRYLKWRYIGRIHTAYIGGYLHFRYLECLVKYCSCLTCGSSMVDLFAISWGGGCVNFCASLTCQKTWRCPVLRKSFLG